MAKHKPLSKADEQLWAAFTSNISLLPGRTRIALDPAPPAPTRHRERHANACGARHEASQLRAPQKPTAKPIHPNTAPAGLDKSTWKTFAAGKRRPEAKLDLHGLTATRAHHAVTAFIHHGHAQNLRCIEIVTGRGEILSRELPHWLNAPTLRPLILAVAHAPTANTGAVRILLRRGREKKQESSNVFEKK
jgi:DNA-nicking Smr family endonuclease